ncbi:MAG TPA: deoxyribodipyrimidine photo-lyase [Rhodopila sp.]|nr:deoxyribodipyrimidine photo-lyase [Rhodopila sp.]
MTATNPPAILWFRNDLRLADHAALHAATTSGHPVLPLYVLDDEAAGRWAMGGAARWWLHHSLASLDRSLRELGASLVLRRGDSRRVIEGLVEDTGARDVFTGGLAEPRMRRLDKAVADSLTEQGARLHRLRTATLFPPDSIRTKSGGTFSVYTPFARACLATRGPKPPIPAPERLTGVSSIRTDRLEDWRLRPTRPDWAGGLRATWKPGEPEAMARAKAFLDTRLSDYATMRDVPGTDGTSMLSPHLRFGEISVVQLWHMGDTAPAGKGRDAFLREVLWREFCANLLWRHPDLPEAPLRPEFAGMAWRDDPQALRAWQQGRTGVPIVDAGMRQLWQTGWMHNRVRMIVASFLIKHLMIPWQDGEAWFWDTLVDADLANNAANWQWIAGCGADAAPYFRIFNPVVQGETFDPDGAYVRQFVPELAQLPAASIHAPWTAAQSVLSRAGVELGKTYPEPLVELAAGRKRALAAYEAIRQR